MKRLLLRFAAVGAVAVSSACGSGQGSGPAELDSRMAAATAAAIDSNGAVAPVGGCHLPPIAPIAPTGLERLALVNPEWTPVEPTARVDVPFGVFAFSEPVLVHGTAIESHVSQEDFPAAHVRYDQLTDLRLDDADAGRLATGNALEGGLLGLEWETGSYPDWAWAGVGDRVVALGRWIFDCGHPEPYTLGVCHGTTQPCLSVVDCGGAACDGASLSYRTEMHPPQATAVIRQGRGAVREPGEDAVPVTRADVFVSADGGGAGDLCVVSDKDLPTLLGAPCFPLRFPLALIAPPGGTPPFYAKDFTFEVPLPAARNRRKPVLRVLPRATPAIAGSVNPARFDAVARLDGPEPRFEVTVRMTQPSGLAMPTGFAATLLAGWEESEDQQQFAHLRVTVERVIVRDALKMPRSGSPEAPITKPGWRLQASVNGEWKQIAGLDSVWTPGAFPVDATYDVYVPRRGSLALHADASSTACVTELFGQTLLTDLIRFGFNGDPQSPTFAAAVQ